MIPAEVVERRQQDLGALRFRQELDRDLDDDAQHAFGTGHQGEQVVTRRIQAAAADAEQLPLDADDLQRLYVVNGEAVLQAVDAAGVFGHVAPDGARDLGRGVGCVVEAEGVGCLRDGQVAHTGLYPGDLAPGVDFENLLELGEAEQDTAAVRQGAAGQTGAGTPGHHWHLQRVAEPHDGLHLLDAVGERHQQGQLAIGGQAIAFVRAQVFFVIEHGLRGQDASQSRCDLGPFHRGELGF